MPGHRDGVRYGLLRGGDYSRSGGCGTVDVRVRPYSFFSSNGFKMGRRTKPIGLLMHAWTDFHTHILDTLSLSEAVALSEKAMVKHWLVNSVDWENYAHFSSLQSRAPLAIIGMGWHPQQVIEVPSSSISDTLSRFEQAVSRAPYLGETGLDFLYGKTDSQKENQTRVFSQFCDWANEHDKLIIVHTRHAKQEAIDILQKKGVKNVILHWFSGNQKQTKQLIENKWAATVGPTILNSPHMDDFIEAMPLELIGLETDSPIPFDGKPSSPDWIPIVGRRVAELKGVSVESVSEAQSALFSRFFPTVPKNPSIH